MRHIEGINRRQSTLFPETLDDYIHQDNPVRFIDAYVDTLDLLRMGFTHAEPQATGRPSYNPADMLKLYIYGYVNRIRSSRRLERATRQNVELLWLMRKLQPDFKTIADFRKENLSSVKQVSRDFILLCKQMDLFGSELIGIDGSKFSAVNHNDRWYTKKKLERLHAKTTQQIEEYLGSLDQQDQAEGSCTGNESISIQEKIAQLGDRLEELESLKAELEASGKPAIAQTDSDSRMMRTARGGSDMSYNVQIAVDDKHCLIAADDVRTTVNDRQELVLDTKDVDVTADAGYYNEEMIRSCDLEGIRCYVAIPPQPNGKYYDKKEFTYDAEQDCYRCPAGEVLSYRGSTLKDKKHMRVYEGITCQGCGQRSLCTRSERGNRRVYRWEHASHIDALRERLAQDPSKLEKRKAMVEHPFGTLKRWMGHGYFLMRGLEKVRGEMAMSVLAYNIKRVCAILGVPRLLELLQLHRDGRVVHPTGYLA